MAANLARQADAGRARNRGHRTAAALLAVLGLAVLPGCGYNEFQSLDEQVKAGWPAEELRRAVQFGQFEDEGWRVRKDGSRFWASVVITALHDEEGRLVLGANIGSGVLAMLATANASPQVRRLPLGNLIFKGVGAALFVPILPQVHAK